MIWTRTSFRTGAAAALLGVALLVAGCGSSSPKASTAATTTATTTAAANSIGTATGADGTYLVGPSGKALYLFDADKNGKSACSGACASAWPPLTVSTTPAVSGGAMSADLGTITRSDGSKQVTYNGHPLYYFAGDSGPGTTSGQGSDDFGADWWLVSTSGAAITKSASSGSPSGGY
jgi:predicted lipoprotein with Yx(FWY)xxD motif